MRSQAFEGTEIYQREQALYLAEMGINQMIYNVNTGTTYSNGQSMSGTAPSGSYAATYYTGDTFGGTAYIKGVGTTGSFTRTVYASVAGSNPDAFKYCLFTQNGGYTKTNNGGYMTITMTNNTYGSSYTYNTSPATVPTPDWAWYTNSNNYLTGVFTKIDNANDAALTASSYSGKIVYENYTGSSATATLTINFGGGSYNISIITNFPMVNIVWNGNNGNTTWTPITYSGNIEYPLLIHNPSITTSSKLTFDLSTTNKNNYKTFAVQGFIYSNSDASVLYGSYWGYLNIKGTLFAKSLTTDWDYNQTTFNYLKDYYTSPSPHFSGSVAQFLPGSYREEY
jgi:hypothetical protein